MFESAFHNPLFKWNDYQGIWALYRQNDFPIIQHSDYAYRLLKDKSNLTFWPYMTVEHLYITFCKIFTVEIIFFLSTCGWKIHVFVLHLNMDVHMIKPTTWEIYQSRASLSFGLEEKVSAVVELQAHWASHRPVTAANTQNVSVATPMLWWSNSSRKCGWFSQEMGFTLSSASVKVSFFADGFEIVIFYLIFFTALLYILLTMNI